MGRFFRCGGYHMNLIAKETDRIQAKILPENSRGTAGYGGANLQDRAPHQPLHFFRCSHGYQLALMDKSDTTAALSFIQVGRGDKDGDLLLQELV